jgi:acyl carrier protein
MNDIAADVKKILARFAKNQEALAKATANTRIRTDLGVSSANLVDVVLEFEEEFDLSIDDDELTKINTFGDAIALIEQKKQKKAM